MGAAICPNCAKENPSEARFCMACGSPLWNDADQWGSSDRFKGVSGLFVGRREEMEALTSTLESALSGMGGLVLWRGGTLVFLGWQRRCL